MKKLLLPLFVLILTTFSFAQEVKKDDWIRVQSDDGEFSFQIPTKHGYFYDKTGFWLHDRLDLNVEQYQLQEMRLVNAFYGKSLICVESYQSFDRGIENIIEKEKRYGKLTNVVKDGVKIIKIVSDFSNLKNPNNYYFERWFLRFDKTTYILTAGSKIGETETTKHFFESVNISTVKSNSTLANVGKLSALKPTPIEYDEKTSKKNKKQDNNQTNETKSINDDLVVLQEPYADPVFSASMNGYPIGTVRLRLRLSEEGRITKIEVLNKLHDRLLRQVVFAAIRMKFIPREKDGNLISTDIIYERSFTNY